MDNIHVFAAEFFFLLCCILMIYSWANGSVLKRGQGSLSTDRKFIVSGLLDFSGKNPV